MIPQENTAAVSRGLSEAFGVTGFEDIRTITKGQTSALVFRIVVRGSPFLLKIITNKKLMIGPARQFACMRAAAGVGVAPQVRYTSIEDGISISDFVDEVPFPASEALLRVPAMLRTLHALPPFPSVENRFNTTCMYLLNPGDAVDAFLQRFQAANILSSSECRDLFAWREQLLAAYPRHESTRHESMVSSHNDLFKPDNVLFDGDRVSLVDWEAACLNDRYVDLATFAHLVVTNEAEERLYLQQYFGHPPDEYQLARYYLMQQLTHMFYAMAFLLISGSGPLANQSQPAPSFGDFHRRFCAGDIQLVDNATKAVYGRVHWERLVDNMRLARFNEAVEIVSSQPVQS